MALHLRLGFQRLNTTTVLPKQTPKREGLQWSALWSDRIRPSLSGLGSAWREIPALKRRAIVSRPSGTGGGIAHLIADEGLNPGQSGGRLCVKTSQCNQRFGVALLSSAVSSYSRSTAFMLIREQCHSAAGTLLWVRTLQWRHAVVVDSRSKPDPHSLPHRPERNSYAYPE